MIGRLHKVICWRVISFVAAGATAWAWFGNELVWESWGLTAWLNVQMTFIHYAFEHAWDHYG